MDHNGRMPAASEAASVLDFSGRVLATEDLRTRLNGHRELMLSARTIITPLAAEDLRSRGIRITRKDERKSATTDGYWGYAQDRPNALVQSAVRALQRDGLAFAEMPAEETQPCRWAKTLAECIARKECRGGVVFCQDPGLVCCVSNKIAGLRAVAVTNVGQAARATLSLAANFLAVEMPGRTYFEIRQILRILAETKTSECPDAVACTLKELESHAHR